MPTLTQPTPVTPAPPSPYSAFSRRLDLPKPCSIDRVDSALVTIYRAKDLGVPHWRTRNARQLVAQARQTYGLYGQVPLLDAYDPKSAVYLARVVSSIDGLARHRIPVEEWITLRFVPATGTPLSTEDLDFYVYRRTGARSDVTIGDLLAQRGIRFVGGTRDIGPEGIITLARLGAIRPRAINAADQPLLESGRVRGVVPTGNQYVAPAFALINRQFLDDCHQNGSLVDLLTIQLCAELAAKLLVVPSGLDKNSKTRIPFAPAHDEFDVKRGEIRLNRQSPAVYAYRYPGYFLNLHDLTAALRGLLAADLITTRCLERYLPSGTTLEHLLSCSPRRRHFGCLGPLLTTDGPIPDCALTGQELRAILDEQVGDGPTLRLATPNELSPALDAAIAAHTAARMAMAA